MSVIRFFDGSYENTFPNIVDSSGRKIFRADLNFSRVAEILDTAFLANGHSDKESMILAGNPDVKKILNYHIGRPGQDYDENDPITARYCRTKIYAGYPLAGYHNIADRLAEQKAKMRQIQHDKLRSYLTDSGIGTMQLFYSSAGLSQHAHIEDRRTSFYYSIGSAVVATIGIIIMCRSVILGLGVVFGIGSTYLWTNLVYRFVFNIQYFGIAQHLSVFVISVFGIITSLNLVTGWNSTLQNDNDGLRLALVLRKTNRIIVANSVISSLTFFVFCFLPVQAGLPFALFNGLFCLINLCNVYIFLPALIGGFSYVLKLQPYTSHNTSGRIGAELWKWALGHKWFRWIGLSLSCVAIAIMTIMVVSTLKLQKSQVNEFKSFSNNFGTFEDLAKEQFGGSNQDTNTKVRIVWGLNKVSRSNCPLGSFKCPLSATYDEAFNLNDNTAVKEITNFCNDLKNLSTAQVNLLKVRRLDTGVISPVTGFLPLEINCFVEDQANYFATQNIDFTQTGFDYDNMQTTMLANPDFYPPAVYNSTSFNPPVANSVNATSCRFCDTYYKHYEIGLLDWISNGGATEDSTFDMTKYVNLVGGQADHTLLQDEDGVTTYAGNYGSTLRYAVVEVNLTLNSENMDYKSGLFVREQWEEYIDNHLTTKSRAVNQPFQTNGPDQTWAWLDVQKHLIDCVVEGLVIASAIVLICVLFCTNNAVIVIQVAIAIASHVVCILGMYAALGWDVGINELTNISIVVGISSHLHVPFTLSYCITTDTTREARTQYAFHDHFQSVIGGSFIALLSSLFLHGSPVWSIYTFAVTFSATLGIGIMLVMFEYIILCGIIGPEGEDWKVLRQFPGLTRSFSTKIHPISVTVMKDTATSELSHVMTPPTPLVINSPPALKPSFGADANDTAESSASENEEEFEAQIQTQPLSSRIPPIRKPLPFNRPALQSPIKKPTPQPPASLPPQAMLSNDLPQ